MIIAGIELIPLRIPVNAGSKSHASPWGDVTAAFERGPHSFDRAAFYIF
jgi:hypothetical protein